VPAQTGRTSLGTELGALVQDPEALAKAFRAAFKELADPEYRIGQERVAPGIGLTHGVRLPLQAGVRRGFDKGNPRGFAGAAPARRRSIAARTRARSTLVRRFPSSSERSRPSLSAPGSCCGGWPPPAADWITVDSLAHPVGKGILREPRRWPELEQLTISPSRWERRLVGSTIATMPFLDHRAGRAPEVAARALAILATLIGDREPDVQKALSWAYRSMLLVDPDATIQALEGEAARAAASDDGHRTWVIRDVLTKLDPERADMIRTTLAGIRRRPGAPSTSAAAELAGRFAGMGLGRAMPEPPLA